MKTALVVLAEGFEEIEAIVPIDLLRRAEVDVTVAVLDENRCVDGRSGVHVGGDMLLETALESDYDLIVLPGGPGHKLLRKDPRLITRLRKHAAENRLIGAICAAPTILLDAGLLENRRYTAHFAVADELPKIVENEAVVVDGNLITSRGAGTAVEFGLALIGKLGDPELACKIAGDICYMPETRKPMEG